MEWKDVHTAKYDPSVSGITKMTPMDDLADKAAAQLCTENTEAIEDWADEDPMSMVYQSKRAVTGRRNHEYHIF